MEKDIFEIAKNYEEPRSIEKVCELLKKRFEPLKQKYKTKVTSGRFFWKKEEIVPIILTYKIQPSNSTCYRDHKYVEIIAYPEYSKNFFTWNLGSIVTFEVEEYYNDVIFEKEVGRFIHHIEFCQKKYNLM